MHVPAVILHHQWWWTTGFNTCKHCELMWFWNASKDDVKQYLGEECPVRRYFHDRAHAAPGESTEATP
jgi:hypothetical protein